MTMAATAANALCGLVALAHVWFLVLEMFLWRTRFARKRLGMTEEQAEATAVLAKNQGLYNGFLAAGLVWGLLAPAPGDFAIKLFFLACVAVAGIYGAATAARQIFFLQALPALLALGAVFAGRRA
ncbi:MAG: DUF1304 domain-containing protein [Myxococcales bacterium]|nr:DUF1304 domain-containing protein [Myxococcales bacterium]